VIGNIQVLLLASNHRPTLNASVPPAVPWSVRLFGAVRGHRDIFPYSARLSWRRVRRLIYGHSAPPQFRSAQSSAVTMTEIQGVRRTLVKDNSHILFQRSGNT